MSDSLKTQEDYEALNEFIVNSHDLGKLEALLGGFNLFQVLKFEEGEIRHSNVLAWIFDPAESHGLDASFLQKWLMRVIHDLDEQASAPVSVIDIDAWRLVEVEVRREWRSIDVLLILSFADEKPWVVCIENKINSVQHSNQLSRYRETVQEMFPDAERIFIFLSKGGEEPQDEAFLPASYEQVYETLEQCLESRKHGIGPEPKVLLENYLRLLEEKFMDESEIAKTALRIYQQHRRALDVIFEHRPDNLRVVSEKVQALLRENAQSLGIVVEKGRKGFVRFIPREWDNPCNIHRGKGGWTGSNRIIIFDMCLAGKERHLAVSSGKAPRAWIDLLLGGAKSPPFHAPKRRARHPDWVVLHYAARITISLENEGAEDPDDTAKKIYDWCVNAYQHSDTQEVIKIIAKELPKLEGLQNGGGSAA